MRPEDAVDALLAQMRDLDRRLKIMEGTQRSPIGGAVGAINSDFTPPVGFEFSWSTAVSVSSSFVAALIIGSVTYSHIGPDPSFGANGIELRLTVDGNVIGQPYLDGPDFVGTTTPRFATLVSLGSAALGSHSVDLEVQQWDSGASSPTFPLAEVSAALFVLPLAAYE